MKNLFIAVGGRILLLDVLGFKGEITKISMIKDSKIWQTYSEWNSVPSTTLDFHWLITQLFFFSWFKFSS